MLEHAKVIADQNIALEKSEELDSHPVLENSKII
jgi:hypothetical protein